MCALNGIHAYANHAPPVDVAELLRTRERMQARGPDGAGHWVSPQGDMALAHRRLAIIDLSADAAQPMATADGRYTVVFNGEIYNHRALRAELQRQHGTTFRTHSDTEVLLHLYAHHGPEMCRHLRGMYAFALWDHAAHTLFMARDPFGIKPLYLHDDGHTLRFASQVKALLAGGHTPAEADPAGLHGYWIWGHVPEPHTAYRHIRAFEPGTWLQLQRGGARRSGRFDSVAQMLQGSPPGPPAAQPPQHTPPTGPLPPLPPLREALLDTVRHHLIADVPVGVFLSAGIDSTTLAALAAEVMAQQGGTLQTVTLGFAEYRGTPADETPLAEQVARQVGARHHTVWITQREFADAYGAFMHDMDQPSIDGLNTWLVSRAARQAGLKVALSGLGGDEFFGGYPSFSQLPQMRRLAAPWARLPALGRMVRRLSAPVLRRFTSEKYAGLLEYGHHWQGAYLLRRSVRMPWELAPPAPQGHTPGSGPEPTPHFKHPHATVSHLEATRYMRNQLLRDSDWASMAHGLELRVPLVDTVLARHVGALTAQGQAPTKQELAATARPALPPSITARPKTGFTVPVRDWMQQSAPAQATQTAPAPHRTRPERGLRGWQRTVLQAQAPGLQPG
jgi:asparagine synthase (glutamine-hydrolysing)